MDLASVLKDGIAELLAKVIEFTETRQKLLARNIRNLNDPGFVPRDLKVGEFSQAISNALCEYLRSERLLFRDTDYLKFGADGRFEARPVRDLRAKALLEADRNRYLELQLEKLLENTLNQRIAAELLRLKSGQGSILG